jgi:hypothetical protein
MMMETVDFHLQELNVIYDSFQHIENLIAEGKRNASLP